MFVSNTDPWSYLGQRPVHLNAGCTFDGGLGLFALRSLAAPIVLRHLRQALSGRGNQRGRKMVRDDDVAWVRVTASQPTRVQVDGDLLGEFTSVEYRAVPNALTIAV